MSHTQFIHFHCPRRSLLEIGTVLDRVATHLLKPPKASCQQCRYTQALPWDEPVSYSFFQIEILGTATKLLPADTSTRYRCLFLRRTIP